jgi:alkylhydroperoxidase/carboxymuconolactone decarboxylase family protein YurZ
MGKSGLAVRPVSQRQAKSWCPCSVSATSTAVAGSLWPSASFSCCVRWLRSGDTEVQLGPHGRACLQVGNSKTAVVTALGHCFPYIGFPRAVAAIRADRNL